MTEYKTEIVFDLTVPIEYHNKGNIEQAYTVTMQAPSNRVKRQSYQLRQGYKRAMKSLMKDFAGSKVMDGQNDKLEGDLSRGDEVMTPQEIVEFFQMSDVDYADFMDIFRSLITNKVATIAEGVYLNSVMFDAISMDDADLMMGEYLSNFLLSASTKVNKSK